MDLSREHVTFAGPHPPAPALNLGAGEPSISKSLSQLGRGIEAEGKRDIRPLPTWLTHKG